MKKFIKFNFLVIFSVLLVSGILGLSSAGAQVLVDENFSSGNAAVPPTDWLNQDAGGSNGQQIWAFNNPGNRTIAGGTPGFSGQFAIIDSDYNGSTNNQNTNLLTPSFDASNTTGNYQLEFDDNWEECCNAVGTVQVFNGTTWVTVFTEPITNGGDGVANPSVHRLINITSATGNFNAAQVRFHYEGDWDFWWAIDNVKITRINCVPPTATFSIVPDCNNNQFSVNANVSNMGSAASLSLSNGTSTFGSSITTAGNYVAGPFTSNSPQTITLIHNDASCNVVSQQLNYNCALPNDNCEAAVVLTQSASCNPTAGTTAGATISNPSVAANCIVDAAGNDVWFSFAANSSLASVQISGLQSSNPNATTGIVGFSVYNATCGNLASPIACGFSYNDAGEVFDPPLFLAGLVAGQTYLIRVHNDFAGDVNYDPVVSDFNFNICVKTGYPPVNDNCADALNVPLGSGLATTAVVSSTEFSSVENGMAVPTCGDELANDIWFTVTVPPSGNVTIQSAAVSSSYGTDVVMVAYSGTCGNLTQISCNDDGNPDSGPSGTHSRIALTGQAAGTTIYIRMTPYDVSQYGPLAMTAWDPVAPVIATTGNCTAVPAVTIDSASGNLYRWVPILDATGKVIAEIHPRGNALGVVNTGIFINSGAVRQANGVYYLDRNITITPAIQPNNGSVDVKLYALETELNALTTMDPAVTAFNNLNLSKSQEACQSAVNAATTQITQSSSGTFADGASNNGGYVQFSTPSFSSFYLRGGTTPLPIKLTSIEAKNTGSSNQVNWSTQSEASGDFFELERSADGRAFSYLSKIIAKGRSSDYVYYDKAPLANESYYRLKLISKEGNFIYSKTVKATLNNHEAFTLEAYPNPVTKNVLVKVYGSENGDVTISDISGKVVLETVMQGSASEIDLSNVAAGVYFIKYTGGNFSKTIKIAKQ